MPARERRKALVFLIVVVYLFISHGGDIVKQFTQSAPISFTPIPSQAVKGENSSFVDVIRVVDGDTIVVSLDGKNEKVRLIGINSPETVDPRRPVECYGKEASAFMKSLLTGKQVKLESDPTQSNRDKYDRLLRYVFLEDGTFVNEQMIIQGFANEYTYELPYQYQSEFKKTEKEAKIKGKGLWGKNTCNGKK